ncbi:MAG TPA: VOC family protein [Candidatus Saccharimonadales bacterium]|nr:VOC family protein [Candidatus Saccharimonadales bacterium]
MKIFHPAISVKNLDTSRIFYETVFDLKFRVAGERPEIGVKFIMLQDKDGTAIELFEHTNPKPLTEDLMDFSNIGMKHIAFIVDDLQQTFDKALSSGATVIWPIQKGVTVKRLAFVKDPDGIPLELVEE